MYVKRAANSYKASTGVGADGLHPKVSLDVSADTCVKIVMFFT